MNKRNRIITVLVSAALTFGLLFASLGPRSANHHHWGHDDTCQQSQEK